MAGVDPGVVVEAVEHPGDDVAEELVERLRACRAADAAREEGVTGEQVRAPSGVAVGERDRPRGVAAQRDDLQGDVPHVQDVTVVQASGDRHVGRLRDRCGIVGTRRR
ncbi:hypothetical protein [Cellulomonas sp.]|uniref:hypothetical protein n=1 Tax=Cellulomonas sp. TaxID=40001 RepID=UPI003BAB83B8